MGEGGREGGRERWEREGSGKVRGRWERERGREGGRERWEREGSGKVRGREGVRE